MFFPPASLPEPAETDGLTPIEARHRLETESQLNWFSITPHRPNYILPATHNFSSDFSPCGPLGEFFNDTEVKFELSLKTRLWPNLWRNCSLWFGCTQLSFWQLCSDEEASKPFRESMSRRSCGRSPSASGCSAWTHGSYPLH